jgi:Ca2+/Na+ antiporter
MLPAANLLGFAGQELSRKLPQKAIAVVLETTLGSVVEIILFMVLLKRDVNGSNIIVIQAAILGSILANILLCLGCCFIAGKTDTPQIKSFPELTCARWPQEQNSRVPRGCLGVRERSIACSSKYGTHLLPMNSSCLHEIVALVLPAVFYKYLANNVDYASTAKEIAYKTTNISRAVAIISLIGYIIYLGYQTISHDGLLHEIYEADEHKDNDRHEELAMSKLTFTEVVVALLISLACVALIAIFLVEQIPTLIERGVSDAFVGLILIPLVEKIAGMYCFVGALAKSNNYLQNIFSPSMKPMTTRSTWLSLTSWVLLFRLRFSTHRLSFSSAGAFTLTWTTILPCLTLWLLFLPCWLSDPFCATVSPTTLRVYCASCSIPSSLFARSSFRTPYTTVAAEKAVEKVAIRYCLYEHTQAEVADKVNSAVQVPPWNMHGGIGAF